MDGLSLAENIRGLPNGRNIPLVMLTSSPEVLSHIEQQYFRTVLLKPVKASRLYNAFVEIFCPEPTLIALSEREKEPSLFDPEMGVRHPLRILLAEDNLSNQKLALVMLERLGYHADVAVNGSEVLAAFERQPFDVILMDVQMPEMDGLDATREIRRRVAVEQQPYIVAMTADVIEDDRKEFIAAGMDDYVGKPILIKDLVAALKRSASKNAPPVLDQASVERVKETLGKQAAALFPELLQNFLTDCVRLLAEAEQALQQKNAKDLRRAAHTLKSHSATFGAVTLTATARQLELLTKEGKLEGAAELLVRAKLEYDKAAAALSRIR